MLARWGFSVVNAVVETIIAGPGGAINAVRSEIGGAVLDGVAGGEIEAVFTAVTHKSASVIQEKNPELTYDEAAALAALGTIATISAGSSLASKIGPILKKWDFKYVKKPADVKLHEVPDVGMHTHADGDLGGDHAVTNQPNIKPKVDEPGHNVPENVVGHEAHKTELRAKMERPVVQDPKLNKIMNDMYKPTARVGSGTTADAVRHEMVTGEPVGGVFHDTKAEQYITALESWVRNNPTAPPGDRAAAENVLKDLQNAFKGSVK
ncbi:hypothetical protein MIDIC_240073 [Alphaproteobacteria bacterium]